MTATNIFYNFVGFRYSSPLSAVFWTLLKCIVLRRVQSTAPYNFSTTQHILNMIHGYRATGFEKPYTNFGVLLSMPEWFTVGYDCFKLGVQIFLVTLMLVPIETFNISFESTQNNLQYGNKFPEQRLTGKAMVIRSVIQPF